MLYSDPRELLATHLQTNTPSIFKVFLHVPEALVFKMAFLFSNNWYDVTLGLASAEQVKLMTFPVHALSFMAELINWTFSGLSKDKRDNLYYNFIGLCKLRIMKQPRSRPLSLADAEATNKQVSPSIE